MRILQINVCFCKKRWLVFQHKTRRFVAKARPLFSVIYDGTKDIIFLTANGCDY
jgi:hypothetical protein